MSRARGRVIPFGKYLLLDRLAVGGMAEVFLAKSFGVQGFEKLIAIKRILPTMAEDQEFIQMFIDEAKIAGHLSHANIVPIYELGKIGDAHYIAMEFVWGKDVLHVVNRFRRMQQRMPPSMAAWIGAMICDGLDYAHSKRDRQGRPLNLIHRDISPQNILVSYEGHVKLIDFGIARAASRTTRTQAGVLKGKFGYMSPEQVRGKAVDHRSDLFAVGTVIHEMLTCERLFLGESDVSTLEKVRTVEAPPPSEIVPGVPAALDAIVMKALAREPDDRYASAADMRRELQRCLASEVEPFGISKMSAWMKEAFEEDFTREKNQLDGYADVGPTSVLKQAGAPPVVAKKKDAVPPAPEAIVRPTSRETVPAPEPDTMDPLSLATGDTFGSDGSDSDADVLGEEATEIFFSAAEDLEQDELVPTPSSMLPPPGAEAASDSGKEEDEPAETIESPFSLSDGESAGAAAKEATLKQPKLRDEPYLLPNRRDRRRTSVPEMKAWLHTLSPTRKRQIKQAGIVSAALSVVLAAALWVLLKPPVGSLTIDSVPRVAARVEVDGKLRGTTPLVLKDVAAGRREIIVRAEGFEVVTRDVKVRPNDITPVVVELEPKLTVVDTGEPAKADDDEPDVLAPENAPGDAPSALADAKAVEREAQRTEAASRAKERREATEARRRAAARRRARARRSDKPSRSSDNAEPATLLVSSVPTARIFIDGKDTGKSTPAFGIKLSPGRHKLGLVTASGTKREYSIKLESGQRLTVAKRLE